MLRTTMEPCTLLHCLRAGGCEEFCVGLRLDHVGDAPEACGQQNWKNSAGTKIWAIGPHWTLDNGNGTQLLRLHFVKRACAQSGPANRRAGQKPKANTANHASPKILTTCGW